MDVNFLTEAIISGFLLGLSTGPLCMSTCLPILLPFGIEKSASGSNHISQLKFLGKFLSGRFMAYITFGMAVGYFGSFFQSSVLNKITLAIMLGLAVLLIAYGLGIKLSHRGRKTFRLY